MKLNELTKKLDKANAEFIPATTEYDSDTIEFLVKSKSYAADDEYIWLNRNDQDSVIEGLQRRIHRMVRVESEDGLEQLPLEDIEALPFDLVISITNAINETQGLDPISEGDDVVGDAKKKPSEPSNK